MQKSREQGRIRTGDFSERTRLVKVVNPSLTSSNSVLTSSPLAQIWRSLPCQDSI